MSYDAPRDSGGSCQLLSYSRRTVSTYTDKSDIFNLLFRGGGCAAICYTPFIKTWILSSGRPIEWPGVEGIRRAKIHLAKLGD